MKPLAGLIAASLFVAVPACAEQSVEPPETPLTSPPTLEWEVPLNSETSNVSVMETHDLVSSGAVTLIDVRRAREWEKTGMADGAVGITLQDDDFLDQILAAVGGDRTRPVALICQTGGRSWFAQQRLQAEGFTTVVNVTGGTRDWLAEGLPVTDYEAD